MRTFNTTLTADSTAIEYLEQLIQVDGPEVVVAEREVRNDSGRVVGTEYDVSDETAEFITESIRRQAAL